MWSIDEFLAAAMKAKPFHCPTPPRANGKSAALKQRPSALQILRHQERAFSQLDDVRAAVTIPHTYRDGAAFHDIGYPLWTQIMTSGWRSSSSMRTSLRRVLEQIMSAQPPRTEKLDVPVKAKAWVASDIEIMERSDAR